MILLFRNFVIGCTMLMPTAIAKEAIPFVKDMVHDHYLALYAATKGSIRVYGEQLIKYRIHEHNQTNVLSDVLSKQDYYDIRIKPFIHRMEQICVRFPGILKAREAYEWSLIRQGYFNGQKLGRLMWEMKKLDKRTTIFELVMPKTPNWIFRIGLRLLQKGKM
jgi:hypothetical protein